MVREPRPGSQHPDDYRRNLNDPLASGDDRGAPRWEDTEYQTAFDVKPVHARLQAVPDDQLKRIPVLPRGTRLEQGATYLDLLAERPEEFTATAEIRASRDNAYVAKSEVDYELWNLLLGRLEAA
jgi:hypothetical protein